MFPLHLRLLLKCVLWKSALAGTEGKGAPSVGKQYRMYTLFNKQVSAPKNMNGDGAGAKGMQQAWGFQLSFPPLGVGRAAAPPCRRRDRTGGLRVPEERVREPVCSSSSEVP